MSGSTLRVLAYHRVTDAAANPSLISASPAVFEQQVQHLVSRYNVVSLNQVLDAQRGGARLPRRAVLLTFDDGYRDFGDVVWPILRQHNISATVFVPTAYPDDPERVFWWDRVHHAMQHTKRQVVRMPVLGTLRLDSPEARRTSLVAVQYHVKRIPHARAMLLVDQLCEELGAEELRGSSVLGWTELRRLAAEGVCLAAHTRTHPALTQLSTDAIAAEVRGSIDDLEREIGNVLPVFCCPFGLDDDRVVNELYRQGVELAFTCEDGHNQIPSAQPLRLRRTPITQRTTPFIFQLRLNKVVTYVDMWRHRPKTRPVVSRPETSREQEQHGSMKIAYMMSRFPKLSETFVLNEILAMESLGVAVEVYPLLRERQPVSHPEAVRVAQRAHYLPFLSLKILAAQWYFLRRRPVAYVRTLVEVLRKTWGSANFFIGTIGIFPKSARFAQLMQQHGVTHAHAHFCSHPAAAALIIHRLTGIPFSFTAHGSDLHVERRMLDTKLEASAFAVTICDFNREVMVQECGEHLRDKIHVIRCGVDTDYFAPPHAHDRDRPFQIICVASFEAVKGHAYLIEACRMLKDRGLEFHCHLIGDGPMRRSVEAQVSRCDLLERVRFHGGQPRAEVARMLSSMDAAVLASHPSSDGKREGLPVALMEAMAAGLPVVASAISGIPELVEDGATGFLIPSGKPEAIATALAQLANDEGLRARMGSAGREKVLKQFSLDANARELLRLFTNGHNELSETAASSNIPAFAG